jgi:predicted regulator of Ras-like GTPase activity (Roadblock/LC7/MglB family)
MTAMARAGQPATTGIAPTRDDAEAAVARLREMSADVRGCAVLGRGGELLAASGDRDRWGDAAAAVLEAADAAGDGPASQLHVATEEGEVFAVREGGLAIVAVSERFALASLMLSDMRRVVRDLARGGG